MVIATWNVNSLRIREERLLAWLARSAPDVACLQELKLTEDRFPYATLEAAGYGATVYGQPTYNGVAILSRWPIEDVAAGFAPGEAEDQARLLSATIQGVRVISAYFPNGGHVGSDKWDYKLAFMARLRGHLAERYDPSTPLALCGDYNVAPDDLDVARPAEWRDTVLCHPAARAALEALRDWGLVDVFRKHHPEGHVYSWWDYRQLAFPKGNGLRIDHIFCTPPLAERSRSAAVDRDERKGEKPSDHAPVAVTFDD
jgi:exodeoxyribonuclease-3